MLAELPVAVNRYAHSEYQTTVSLRMKAALDRIAPAGAHRHFVVNTGAEAVENAIKAVLLSRVRGTGEKDGGYIISFEGAYHGRTLGSLAVTHRKRARLGFPTFDWPQAPWPLARPRRGGHAHARGAQPAPDLEPAHLGRHAWRRAPQTADEPFAAQLARIDGFLERGGSLDAFVAEERARLPAERLQRALRCAGVLAEPIQGEGGIRLASGRFFRRLRVLTRVFDVPLLFDEIQTGFGATGRMWAHQHFDLPAPARRRHLGQEGAERGAVRLRGAGDLLPGGEEVQHHLGGRRGRHGPPAGHHRSGRPRGRGAHRGPGARAGSSGWRATSPSW